MSKISKAAALATENAMFDVYLERGSCTRDDLIRAGFSEEEIALHSPRVAERILKAETARAAA